MTLFEFIGGVATTIALLLIAAVVDALRNGVDPIRAYQLIPSDKNPEIIGDGAWHLPPAEYPKTARAKDIPEYPLGA